MGENLHLTNGLSKKEITDGAQEKATASDVVVRTSTETSEAGGC